MNHLSKDLLRLIFLNLDLFEIKNVKLVNKLLNKIVNDEYFCKMFAFKHFGDLKKQNDVSWKTWIYSSQTLKISKDNGLNWHFLKMGVKKVYLYKNHIYIILINDDLYSLDNEFNYKYIRSNVIDIDCYYNNKCNESENTHTLENNGNLYHYLY